MQRAYSNNFKTHDRYFYQGSEMDMEIKGNGNSYDFGERMLDPRLGRWLSRDNFEKKYPEISPYVYSVNSPILLSDENGDYPVALHYVITYKVMISLGFSEDISKKVAHFSSVYADHPDWSLYYGAMYNMNVNLMKNGKLPLNSNGYR
jgi:RHS repeat-associated protein